MHAGMTKALALLEEIAPLRHAESWDNVGLLVEPAATRRLRRVFLAIDLTEDVMAEAMEARADLVCAYHPPIFAPLKRLAAGPGPAGAVLAAARAGIGIYSPHTALDAAPGGLNDWLAEGLGAGISRPLQVGVDASTEEVKLVVFVPAASAGPLRAALAEAGAGEIGAYRECSFTIPGRGTFRGLPSTNPAVGRAGRLEEVEELRLEMIARASDLPRLEEVIRGVHPYEEPAFEAYRLVPRPPVGVGMGRERRLDRGVGLATIVKRVKRHLGLARLRVAAAMRHRDGAPLERLAVCAGAGGSVLAGARADLLLTGEMRHHDVLAAVARGTSVILCDHTNTERGYLPRLAERLSAGLGAGVEILVSRRDRDPLEII
ncbi:MAG: Nif3-like dinuclear metal center hexameric protein [Planctomycetota bacterium]